MATLSKVTKFVYTASVLCAVDIKNEFIVFALIDNLYLTLYISQKGPAVETVGLETDLRKLTINWCWLHDFFP